MRTWYLSLLVFHSTLFGAIVMMVVESGMLLLLLNATIPLMFMVMYFILLAKEE